MLKTAHPTVEMQPFFFLRLLTRGALSVYLLLATPTLTLTHPETVRSKLKVKPGERNPWARYTKFQAFYNTPPKKLLWSKLKVKPGAKLFWSKLKVKPGEQSPWLDIHEFKLAKTKITILYVFIYSDDFGPLKYQHQQLD